MFKTIIQLQQSIKTIRDKIVDILHLAYLNHQSYLCLFITQQDLLKEIPTNIQDLNQKRKNTKHRSSKFFHLNKTKQEHEINDRNINIERILNQIPIIFDKRTENHLNYLIIKQIQSQQECVRRDRLNEYEEKIYDQRRIISDKQVFLETLLRPKRRKPDHVSSEQFQQLKNVDKITEESTKLTALEQEIKSLQRFKKKLLQSKQHSEILTKKKIQISSKLKSDDLQKTNANSLQTVNLSTVNNLNLDKQQRRFDSQEISGVYSSLISQDIKKQFTNSTKEIVQSQQILGFQNNTSIVYSIEIDKLIQKYQKVRGPKQTAQKLHRILLILQKINKKKQENSQKNKQLKELKIQNVHMKNQLKKIQIAYRSTCNDQNFQKIK